MFVRSLLSTLALTTCLTSAAFAEDSANPLMTYEFWTDKTTVAMVQAELDKGFGVEERDRYGSNPLHFALEGHSSLEVLQFLIDQGADVNQPEGKKGDPVALYAAYTGSIDTLKLLDAADANWQATDDLKCTALHWLVYNTEPTTEMVDFLLAEGIDPAAQCTTGDTAAMEAGWSEAENASAIYDYLIEKGSPDNGFNSDGDDAFMKAISWAGKGEWLERLYGESEDPEAANNNGLSGILLASQWGVNKDRLEFLEAKGFDLQVESPKGENAIILNSIWGDAESMKLLLDRGFDINSEDDKGNTPLLKAMVENEIANIRAIIDAGADVTHANDKGETALLLGLARANDDPDSDAGKELTALVDYLIEKGGDLTLPDAAGATSLIYAVKSGQPFARIEQIIAAGVDVNKTDAEGTTALMHAAISGKDAKVIELLVNAGADKTVTDVFEETAAVMAAENEALKDSPVLALLQ